MGSILPSQPVHHQIPRSPPRPSGELCRKAAPRSSPVGKTILSHPRFPCKAPRGNPAPCFFFFFGGGPPAALPPTALCFACTAPRSLAGLPRTLCVSLPSSPPAPGCPLQTILELQGARGRMDVPLGPVRREKRDGWGASGWAREPARLPAGPVGTLLVAGMCVRMGLGGTCRALAAAHSPGSSCVCTSVCPAGTWSQGEKGNLGTEGGER